MKIIRLTTRNIPDDIITVSVKYSLILFRSDFHSLINFVIAVGNPVNVIVYNVATVIKYLNRPYSDTDNALARIIEKTKAMTLVKILLDVISVVCLTIPLIIKRNRSCRIKDNFP